VSESLIQPYLDASPLSPEFFLDETSVVAQQLLGKSLVLQCRGDWLAVRIVEVEAYLAEGDQASHAFRGQTPRNWPMFEPGGTCYVYLSYGIHHCMNVSTGNAGKGEAVLLRAVEPIFGQHRMLLNRPLDRGVSYQLCNGPGKLTRALGIDLAYNGLRFNSPSFKLVDLPDGLCRDDIGISPRIGISQAKDKPLRFFIKSSEWLSRPGR
jgi:DNA-3-methyladenine glycosylase